MRYVTSLALLGCFLLGSVARAEPEHPNKIPVVGVLFLTPGPSDAVAQSLRKGLAERGYVDGKNIHIEYRYAQGKIERIPDLARELVNAKVDVIVTGSEPIVRAVKQATSTIPIVNIAWDYDPVAAGLIESLSRPGGNITGIYPLAEDLAAKRLQMLKDLKTKLRKVGVLYVVFSKRQIEQHEAAARKLRLQLLPLELVGLPYDYERVFKAARRARVEAVSVLFSPHFYADRERLARTALAQKLPTIFFSDPFVPAGGLMSYGPDMGNTFVRAAYYVDRILKGAKPSELPVEQPYLVKLTINLKTAKALGLTIPESIMLQANEVIR